jgi:hypothetical protein
MDVYKTLSPCAQVMSADGNMAQKMATQFAKFWQNGVWVAHPERHTNTPDLYLECWRRSCVHIRDAWARLTELPEGERPHEVVDESQLDRPITNLSEAACLNSCSIS